MHIHICMKGCKLIVLILYDCFLWLLSNVVVEGVEYVSCEPRLVERRCAQPLEVLAQASGHAQHSYEISCISP